MSRILPEHAGGQNICAFLDMLAFSEIGKEMLALSDDGYNVLVGSLPSAMLTFPSYADHPNVYNKHCNSDAAGRYQIMHRWWPVYKKMLSLPDFSPISQDLYAIQQLKEQKAFPLIQAGNFADAVQRVSDIWASLPGSQYGQHTNQLEALKAAYLNAGGVIL